jgi:hypothetical protein
MKCADLRQQGNIRAGGISHNRAEAKELAFIDMESI